MSCSRSSTDRLPAPTVVASSFGTSSQWYRNVEVEPSIRRGREGGRSPERVDATCASLWGRSYRRWTPSERWCSRSSGSSCPCRPTRRTVGRLQERFVGSLPTPAQVLGSGPGALQGLGALPPQGGDVAGPRRPVRARRVERRTAASAQRQGGRSPAHPDPRHRTLDGARAPDHRPATRRHGAARRPGAAQSSVPTGSTISPARTRPEISPNPGDRSAASPARTSSKRPSVGAAEHPRCHRCEREEAGPRSYRRDASSGSDRAPRARSPRAPQRWPRNANGTCASMTNGTCASMTQCSRFVPAARLTLAAAPSQRFRCGEQIDREEPPRSGSRDTNAAAGPIRPAA